jgi:two-component system response regulator FixJ
VPKTVYVVDDDHLFRDVICTRLGQAGYPAQGFGEPDAFLAVAPSLTDGCIVLDLDMPAMDGLQVQRRLGELGCELPVIFYSGQAGVRHAVHGMRAGAIDFLQKSSEMEPLLKAIQKLIGKPEAAQLG